MIGQIATRAISTIEGATMSFARRRSGMPRERRWLVEAPTETEPAAMVLERRQCLVHLGLGGLQRILGGHAAGQRLVDVLVDRLRDLRVDRRDRAGLRLGDR